MKFALNGLLDLNRLQNYKYWLHNSNFALIKMRVSEAIIQALTAFLVFVVR